MWTGIHYTVYSIRINGYPLSAKSSFYLPAFEISRSCRTASDEAQTPVAQTRPGAARASGV